MLTVNNQHDPILRTWRIRLKVGSKLRSRRVRNVIAASLPFDFFTFDDRRDLHFRPGLVVEIDAHLKPHVWTTRAPIGIVGKRLNKTHSVAAIRERLKVELEENYGNGAADTWQEGDIVIDDGSELTIAFLGIQ